MTNPRARLGGQAVSKTPGRAGRVPGPQQELEFALVPGPPPAADGLEPAGGGEPVEHPAGIATAPLVGQEPSPPMPGEGGQEAIRQNELEARIDGVDPRRARRRWRADDDPEGAGREPGPAGVVGPGPVVEVRHDEHRVSRGQSGRDGGDGRRPRKLLRAEVPGGEIGGPRQQRRGQGRRQNRPASERRESHPRQDEPGREGRQERSLDPQRAHDETEQVEEQGQPGGHQKGRHGPTTRPDRPEPGQGERRQRQEGRRPGVDRQEMGPEQAGQGEHRARRARLADPADIDRAGRLLGEDRQPPEADRRGHEVGNEPGQDAASVAAGPHDPAMERREVGEDRQEPAGVVRVESEDRAERVGDERAETRRGGGRGRPVEEGEHGQELEERRRDQERVATGLLGVGHEQRVAGQQERCQKAGPLAGDPAGDQVAERHRRDAEERRGQPECRLAVAERQQHQALHGEPERRVGLGPGGRSPEIAEREMRPTPGEGLVEPERFGPEPYEAQSGTEHYDRGERDSNGGDPRNTGHGGGRHAVRDVDAGGLHVQSRLLRPQV